MSHMATESFTTEFKLSLKAAASLIAAVEGSKRVDVVSKHEARSLHEQQDILDEE